MRLTVLGVIGVLALGIGVATTAPAAPKKEVMGQETVPAKKGPIKGPAPTAAPKKGAVGGPLCATGNCTQSTVKVCTDVSPPTNLAVLDAWVSAANKVGQPVDISVIYPGAVSAGVQGSPLTTTADTCQGNTVLERACQGTQVVSRSVDCTMFGPGVTCQTAANGRGFCALPDTDADQVADFFDNCPKVPNTSQTNSDLKGRGDACTFKSISFYAQHACAVSGIGEVWCWGMNNKGQLGNGNTGSTEKTLVPQKVSGLTDITQVVTGFFHTCALSTTGTVRCWGDNDDGQLGDGSGLQHLKPAAVPGLGGVTQLAAGAMHTCAVANGGVWCWGENAKGQVGDGTRDDRSLPTFVSSVTNAQQVAAGRNSTCAVDATDQVSCWGELTHYWSADQAIPSAVPNLPPSVSVSIGFNHACVIDNESRVWCWGNNDKGELGNGTFEFDFPLTMIPELTGISQVSTGHANSTCAASSDGQVSCWGEMYIGQQQGEPILAKFTSPQPVTGLAATAAVSVANNRYCALDQQGQAWCWGIGNGYGELGNGTTSPSATPVPVAF